MYVSILRWACSNGIHLYINLTFQTSFSPDRINTQPVLPSGYIYLWFIMDRNNIIYWLTTALSRSIFRHGFISIFIDWSSNFNNSCAHFQLINLIIAYWWLNTKLTPSFLTLFCWCFAHIWIVNQPNLLGPIIK